MRSEMRLIRARERYGALLTASITVLILEAVLGGIALTVWTWTQVSPDLPYNAMNYVFWAVMAVVLAVVGVVAIAVASVGLVIPLAQVAGWLGRAWWWIPVVAASVSLAPVFGWALAHHAGFRGALGMWLAAAAGWAVPALVVRRLLLPDRPRIGGGAMFGWLALYGTLAVVTAVALAGIGRWAGIGYEPPRMSVERLAGTWTDGEGGTLVLGKDGRATATGLNMYDFEGTKEECSGAGSWSYQPGGGAWDQGVGVTVEGCESGFSWEFYGTEEQPRLFSYIGDPDSWDTYELERRG
ncbi:hypothetical protein [Streptomyces solicathayae]|uniref:Integral membrane protein n=1 Tax=Streptomyces solicathayae TaxID=3081768 RepID=A0ABZ0LWS3_9ACTN|nr:hypothetical protein [Streptomyces sp. HUAS YS2]WOX23775.1 hypothetical protein R2D22_21260 [Streptomyces sp. HUAS YS2]